MSSFFISARKYRPTSFSQIQGQSHITTTLQNALKKHQLAQVFLFCGPKGTGKTTCARVLAKAVNCEQLINQIEPCNTCVSCQSIQKNQSLNIHELDAASHNSVEDIRNLVDQVHYRPARGKKIFIIDEAHMLSNAAFNGLLKTLEEPPAYVIFIFATTEKYKVIDTILSRCQIFDFHYLSNQEIIRQLQHVAKVEEVSYEPEAFELIAYQAEGSLRDALSSFDLIVNFEAQKKVSYEATLRHLNLLDHTFYFKLTNALIRGEVGVVLMLYSEVIAKSFRGDQFITGFSAHLRNVLTTQVIAELPLLNVPKSNQADYAEQAKQMNSLFLHDALQIAHQYGLNYKNAENKRLHIEIMLIQIAHIAHKNAASPSKPSTAKQLPAPPTQPSATSKVLENKKKAKVVSEVTHPSSPQNTLNEPGEVYKQAPKNNPKIVAPTLTQEMVWPHWQAFAKSIEQEDAAGFSIMQTPIHVEGHTITIHLVSSLQKEKIVQLKPKLTAYLATKCKHKNVVIKEMLKPKNQAKVYTPEENLQQLVAKNVQVAKLKTVLGLEAF
ncbi:MAG: DNA polymerase III subunit gamma/tau [Bacteroidota bacterium]